VAASAEADRFATMEYRTLQTFIKKYSGEMNDFFKSGGTKRVPKDVLLAYKELIIRYLGETGGAYQKINATAMRVQSERLNLIIKALRTLY